MSSTKAHGAHEHVKNVKHAKQASTQVHHLTDLLETYVKKLDSSLNDQSHLAKNFEFTSAPFLIPDFNLLS